PSAESLANLDQAIATTVTTRLGPSGDIGDLGITPPAAEQALVDRIASDEAQLADVVAQIHGLDQSGSTAAATQLQGSRAEPLVHDLESVTDQLVGTTSAATDALITDDRSSLADSERTFAIVAVLGVLLALVAGVALSWSVVGPIKRMETRLASIASGDFSGRVDVPN